MKTTKQVLEKIKPNCWKKLLKGCSTLVLLYTLLGFGFHSYKNIRDIIDQPFWTTGILIYLPQVIIDFVWAVLACLGIYISMKSTVSRRLNQFLAYTIIFISTLEFIELVGTVIFKFVMYEFVEQQKLQLDPKTLSIVSIILRCSGVFIYPFFGCFAFFYSVSVDNEYREIIEEENLETSSIYQSSIELWSIGESIVALAVTVIAFLSIFGFGGLGFLQIQKFYLDVSVSTLDGDSHIHNLSVFENIADSIVWLVVGVFGLFAAFRKNTTGSQVFAFGLFSITIHAFTRGFSSLLFIPLWLIAIGAAGVFILGLFSTFVSIKYMLVLEKYLQSMKNKDMKEFEISKEENFKEFAVDSEMLNTGDEVTFSIPPTTESQTDLTHTENTVTETKSEAALSIKIEPTNSNDTKLVCEKKEVVGPETLGEKRENFSQISTESTLTSENQKIHHLTEELK
eukprot:gene469-6880_t